MIEIAPRTFRLLSLLVMALISHALYASLVPPWQAPDEPSHFEVAELIHAKGRAVTYADRGPGLQPNIVASLDRNKFFQYTPWADREHVILAHQLHQSQQLYYELAAWTWPLTPRQPIESQLLVMRFFSVAMAMAVVALASLTIERLFPRDRFLQWTVPAFVGLLPMSTFISSSVNNDNLANLVVAAGILVITNYLMQGARWLDVLAFAILLPLAALAKRSALVLIPIGFVAAALSLFAESVKRKTKLRWWFVASVASVLVMLAILVLAFRSEAVLVQVRSVYQRLTYTSDLPSLSDLAQVVKENSGDYLVATFTSFWGDFGWLTIRFPDAVYWLLLGLTGFVMLGFVRYYVRALRLHEPQSSVMVVYLVTPIILFLAAALAFGLYDTDPTNLWWGKGALPQGRYLFPALIPIATLFMLGVREFIPARFRGWGAAAVIAILAGFNLGSLFLAVLPYFHSI